MAIADVVTMGYGSFSSVNKIPTLGYSIGAVIVGIPTSFAEGEVYVPGVVQGDTFTPGILEGDVYVPGIIQGET